MFLATRFEESFRMSETLFTSIVEEVTIHCSYFREKEDRTGRLGVFSLMKCTSTIHQLAHGTVPDALDEYLSMDWAWFGCTIAHKAQYCRRDHGADPFILLEVVASEDLWIWQPFFGVAGSNNDINVIHRSPLLNDLKLGKASEIPFVANDVTYHWGYYLCDEIYPEWVPFVKSVTNLSNDYHKRLRYKAMHEGAKKDVERAFGALKKQWAILTTLARAYIKEKLANIMYTCIILHNTIIKDRMEAICINWYPEKEHQPDDLIRSDEQRHRIISSKETEAEQSLVGALFLLKGILLLGYRWLTCLLSDELDCRGTSCLVTRKKNANVKRWSPLYVEEPTNEDDPKKYSIFGYTWAFRYFDRYNRYPRVAALSKKNGRFLGHMVIPFFEEICLLRDDTRQNEAPIGLVDSIRHTLTA
ncbi:ALP1-like protein [Tanacetum coccineum]|uniref:ALP1-like protein n=1 Tax=Tanacetum coccineum TaxID=301880 RepID=A0ABQ4XUA4_9ASTR